ncbi:MULTISPECIES: DegT/DnrJ/EryC1/StrS family aminotransferase [Gulbenkiania]|uniref:dTDP-4-amino-4,6-dideoxygalactose transaminase n=2 Tax=Gulbenkiania TaxID=397456 RepID=A0A0K6GZC3_9NEIS|nr:MULTISPECIES: DegT/DnrJ/EryC1/StrS family aminotransferase [Gulbenkiania]TCW28632.1 UDP-2-acetamido-2-deoxy-ribo-hexuluronate aminotransferase [Gulbenkiania mobilis]CUA84063.1 dTDP-4-amino-4,6-dideoxygalactose transaminase [Gulbenkiania indica]
MSLPFIDLKTQYRHLKGEIDARMQAVLDHGQFIMGPEVLELEEKLAEYVGVRHAIGVCDGTAALQIALMAIGLAPGDEVITTPFTFIATGEVVALLGGKPVFVDIDPDTYNLDPALIEAAITPRTRAIMPVSLYGQCADFDTINAIAQKHGLAVIEDGAQSFGATRHGRRSGALSTIGCTSFFPSKPLGCYGDGGAIFTDDDALAARMRQLRVHGQDTRYHHPLTGMNGRLDTLQAAVLLAKLPSFPEEVEARARIGARYSAYLEEVARVPRLAEGNTHVYAQYTLEVDDRTRVQQALQAAGIPTAVHYPIPLHRQPAFAHLGLEEGAFPVAESASRRVLSLPMHPFLDAATQDTVIAAVRQALA